MLIRIRPVFQSLVNPFPFSVFVALLLFLRRFTLRDNFFREAGLWEDIVMCQKMLVSSKKKKIVTSFIRSGSCSTNGLFLLSAFYCKDPSFCSFLNFPWIQGCNCLQGQGGYFPLFLKSYICASHFNSFSLDFLIKLQHSLTGQMQIR